MPLLTLETDKEMEGNRSATSSGSIIALFFLIAYAVLTWQIELINFKGGIEEDTTPTFLDKYKGRFGYLFAALNNIFDVKFIDFVNILFKKAGVENKVQEIIEIKSSQILRTTTTFPIATAERKPIGFFMEAVPSSAELVRTPVQAVQEDIQPVQNNIQTHIQDIKGVHTANYVLDKKEVVARLKLAKQSVMVNIRFLNRGERETPTTYQNIENTIPNVMKLLDETNDEATILDIQIWRRELEETLLNNAGYQAWKMIKEVQNAA